MRRRPAPIRPHGHHDGALASLLGSRLNATCDALSYGTITYKPNWNFQYPVPNVLTNPRESIIDLRCTRETCLSQHFPPARGAAFPRGTPEGNGGGAFLAFDFGLPVFLLQPKSPASGISENTSPGYRLAWPRRASPRAGGRAGRHQAGRRWSRPEAGGLLSMKYAESAESVSPRSDPSLWGVVKSAQGNRPSRAGAGWPVRGPAP